MSSYLRPKRSEIDNSVLRFSKKADYGLMAIHYIAFHQHAGVVNTKRIAEDLGIPVEVLAKILQRLAKRSLIASVNGPKGGYVLARPPGEIRISEVLRAIEGPFALVNCYRTLQCPQLDRCNIRRPVLTIQTSIERFLEKMTLEQMNSLAEPAGLPSTLAGAKS
ncbi:MAG TPA: Rrf2 family transcriptional regulator [Actinomycetota bacterium]|nr:Rrf2 family transcriptional regulator [Actinomycetota bacterium]